MAREALALADREGAWRVFLDQGAALWPLLAVMSTDEATRLETLLAGTHAGKGPLSEREMDVLRLMAEGLSNQQIAARLVVTEGTAKWHIHNILSKLEVNSRALAVARARDLGLLDR